MALGTAQLDEDLKELRAAMSVLRIRWDALQNESEELARGRQRYQDLFEFASVAYLVTSPGCTIRETNRAAVRMLRFPAPMLAGKPFAVLVDLSQRREFRDRLAALRSGEAWPASWPVRMGRQGTARSRISLEVRSMGTAAGFCWALRAAA
jgi:PAS domain-containing protein